MAEGPSAFREFWEMHARHCVEAVEARRLAKEREKDGMKEEIELGATVKDKVTGVDGIAVQRVTYLYGKPRIGVQRPGLDSRLHTHELEYIDEDQLETVKKPE